MKKLLLTCTLLMTVAICAHAQDKRKSEWQADKFRFTISGSYTLLPIKLSGLMDEGSGGSSLIDGNWVTGNPEYAIKDTTALMMGALAHLGVHIPFYRTPNWSTGVNLHAGMGYMKDMSAAEGLEGLVFDFPQFLYYRNYKSKLDYSLLLGYKYTKAALPYHMALGGIEFNIKDRIDIRLYGGLNEYKYYRYYTDGRIEPALRLREFGVTLVSDF